MSMNPWVGYGRDMVFVEQLGLYKIINECMLSI